MLISKIVQNLTPQNLNFLDADAFNDELVVKKLEELSADPVYENEPALAHEFHENLEKLLKQFAEFGDRPVYQRYNKILARLLWQSLPSLNASARQNAVGSQLVVALKNKIDVLVYITRLMDIYEFMLGEDKGERQKFLYALSNNEERLGSQNLMLKTQDKLPQIIKNWIKDFISYTPVGVGIGKFEKISYLSTSPNASKLSKDEREIIARVIDLYIWLKHPEMRVTDPEIIQPITPKPVIPIPRPPVMPPPVPHGQDLEVLRKQMQSNLPKKEIASSSRQGGTPRKDGLGPVSAVKMTPEEIKREVSELELPAYVETSAGGPERTGESRLINPSPLPASKSPLASLNEITTIEDLRKIDLAHLRQGPLFNQVQLIKDKIIYLSQANKLIPYYTVKAFEQSPLFQLYLKVGGGTIQDPNADRGIALRDSVAKSGSDLTLQEFGLIADLRKELERL